MILINLNSVNTISEKIKKYYEYVNIRSFSCPRCNSFDFIYYGTYHRNVVFLENDTLHEEIIVIKRILCKSCNHTHALIPDFLSPYKIFSLNTIILIVSKSFNNNLTKLESLFYISRQLILKWKKSFNFFLNKLYTLYSVFDLSNLFKKILYDENLSFKFYKDFNEILFVKRSNIFFRYIPT